MADANMYIMNPVFQAESFNEMVQPLTLYAQAYKEQEAKIEDMTDKAAALEWIANQDPESQTAALYRDMSDKIKGLRDNIMVNGLTGGLRSQVLGARRMYSANSAEITRRYEDMKAYRDRMAALQDKDSSMVFSPESLNVSLDDFAGGRRPLIKAISGNEVMARGAAIGKRLSSQVFGSGVQGKIAEDQFWALYKQSGMTDQDLFEALRSAGHSDKFNMVKQVIDGVYNSFSDFDENTLQQLKNRFIEGVYSGAVYARDVEYKENGEYMTAAQRASADLQQKQYDLEKEKYEFGTGQSWMQLADGTKVRIDPTTNEYVTLTKDKDGNVKTSRVEIPADKDDEAKELKAEQKKQKEELKKRMTQVYGIDEHGNKINVANNTALGKPLTPADRDEINRVRQMFLRTHKGQIVPGLKYRYYKHTVTDEADNTKTEYYLEPVLDSRSAVITASQATPRISSSDTSTTGGTSSTETGE